MNLTALLGVQTAIAERPIHIHQFLLYIRKVV